MFDNKILMFADIQFYNNQIYTLIENIGLVMQNQSGNILNTWAFTQSYSKFNIFIDQFGVKTVLLGTDYQLIKYKLQGNGLFTINEQYGIEKIYSIAAVYHNNKFSLVQGSINKLTDRNVIWVFDDQNRLASNLFISISNSKIEDSFIIFNPLTNQIFSLFRSKAIRYKIFDPVLTIDSQDCKPENGSIIIYGTAAQEQTCTCHLNIQYISKNDYGIFQLENTYSKMQVTDQSLNEFSLSGIVKGANIQYSDNLNGLKYFLFKNQTSIFNAIQPNDNILLHKIYVLETDPIKIMQIIQINDINKTLYIYICETGESQSEFTCKILFQRVVRQQISILISRSYINPTYIAYTAGDNNVTIIYQLFIGNLSVLTQQFNYFDQIKGILYISQQYMYIVADNKIDLYEFTNKQFNLLNTITPEQLSNLINFKVTNIFNIHNKLEDNYLYISVDIGIITIDTGLYRYNQINLVSFYQFTYEQLQPYNVILANHWVIVKLVDQLYVLNYKNHQKPFYQKILQTYHYKFEDPLTYSVGDNSSLLYIKASNNQNHFYLIYALDEYQLSTLFTTISCDDLNAPAAISTREQDYVFYFNKSEQFHNLKAIRIYKDIKYIFQSAIDNKINIQFQGMVSDKINYQLEVNVINTDQQLNLSIIDSDKVHKPIYYNDLNTDIINLEQFNELVQGSVGKWKMKCYKCPEELQLINYIDFYRNLSNIGSANQIKRSSDYVFVQQKSNLIAIDSGSDITFVISLPITDANFDCQTLAPSLFKQKTLFVVSVCNSQSLTQFFVTSFVSSQPFAMGPFTTQIFLHSISHIRVLNELIFLLDDFTDTIYVFDLELAVSSAKNELKLKVYLNAEDVTKDNSYFINFDVAFIDENQPSYIIFLLTNKQQLILFQLTKLYDGSTTYGTQYDPPYNLKNIVTDQPTNVIPTNVIIAKQDLSQEKKQYRIIIVNENYHHFEFNVIISIVDTNGNFSEISFVKAYLSYGYYIVSGKSRASEMGDGFFGAIYINPLLPSQKVLVVYDSKDYVGDVSESRKLWGGYQINTDSKILFDFLHKGKNENSKKSEIQNGIILIVGGNITSLSLSRNLAIKVNNKQFKDRQIQFNATNDFDKTVTFEKDIFNQTGMIDNMILWIILSLMIAFVIVVSIIIVKRRLKKNNEVHTISDLTFQNERQYLNSQDLSPSYCVTLQRENLIQNF